MVIQDIANQDIAIRMAVRRAKENARLLHRALERME